MKNKRKEFVKILKFNGTEGIEFANKLSKIANLFNTSNRRTLQFCLADVHNIKSNPKPPRFFNSTKVPSVIFLPFSTNGLTSCSEFLSKNNLTFKLIAFEAIDKILNDISTNRKLVESIHYQIYIDTIYNDED